MKKIISVLATATILIPYSHMNNAYSAEATNNLWSKFIKYDLCITNYDSLTDEEKELCQFIFDTEQAANDNVICERARRILAGDDVGERITLEQLDGAYGIWDNYSEEKMYGWQYYTHCVPDIIHLDDVTDPNSLTAGTSEYWLDDSGSTYVVFNEKTSSDDIRSFDIFNRNGELLKNIPSAMPECPYKDFRGDAEYMEKFGFIEKNGGYYYTKPDGTAVFAWSNYAYTASNSKPITTPFIVESEINGCPVTAIENGAFVSSPFTTVILPDTLEFIDYNAFGNCIYLKEIKLPENLKYLGRSAFINCTSLNSVTIDCPKLRLKEDTFLDCNNLKSMDINVREIGERSLSPALESVHLGEDIEKIDFNAFSICENLSNCDIPAGVKMMCQGAFINSGVKSVTIPPNVQIIGAYPRKTGKEFTSGIEPPSPRRPLTDDPICAFDRDCVIYGYRGTEAERYANEWNLKFVALEAESGDVNFDGVFNISDVVTLQSWLLGKSNSELSYWKSADLCEDGEINVFDLCIMKRMLVER